jgi:hypothetical protein
MGVSEDSKDSDEEFPFHKFKKLSKECIDEIKKVPGITFVMSDVDESGVVWTILKPENYEALLTATKILDSDSLIQITPSLKLDSPLRQYQFDVHTNYSKLTSTYLKKHPDDQVPVVYQPRGQNPINLIIQLRSALIATLHEIQRFKSNYNPAVFNQI